MPQKRKASTEDLRVLLRKRYSGTEWAVFEEVHDATGYSHSRSCDAIVMNLRPSGGLELHGFELKTSRADWLNELRDPDKAETFKQFCDRWWLVTSDQKTVKPEELPEGWGLLWVRKDKLVSKRGASQLQPKPLGRPMLAALLRRASESSVSDTERRQIQDKASKQRHAVAEIEIKRLHRKYTKLQQSVQEFQKASGIEIRCYRGQELGEAVETLLKLKSRYGALWNLDRARRTVIEKAKRLGQELESVVVAARQAGLIDKEKP